MIFFCYKTQRNYNILQKTNRIRHWTPRSTVAKKQADFAGLFFLAIHSIDNAHRWKNIWYTNCHYAVQNTSPMLNLRHWMFAYKGSSSFIIFQRKKDSTGSNPKTKGGRIYMRTSTNQNNCEIDMQWLILFRCDREREREGG